MPELNTEQRRLAAIMFTDMVGYSALSQHSEPLALELLAEQQRLLRSQFPAFNGREVKTTGDGFLVEFPSALDATQCAVEIQRAVANRNSTQPTDRHFQVRIGIHVGDVVHREADMYGDGVNIAARIEPLAMPGGICVTRAVFEQIENKVPHKLVQLSRPELKNISAKVEVYRLELDATPTPAPANRARKVLISTVTFVVVLNILLFLRFGLQQRSGKTSQSPATNTAPALALIGRDQKSVAVLPFLNLSADKADEYLSDGMTEELLNALARVKGLRVPGRSSSFAFKGKTGEDILRKMGEQLHVTAVLEGSVRKAGEKLRITAQLSNVPEGFQLWSEEYDRDMTNIFAIQSDIAARVAEALKVQLLGSAAPSRKPTESLEAYKLYLQGRQLWNRRTGESLTEAINYFNQAIAADPAYALAYSGLADCYAILEEYSGMPSTETVPRARAAAVTALKLDETLGEPHAALGHVKAYFDWDWSGAEAELRRALELNPNYATTHHWFGIFFESQGRFAEGLTYERRAQDLDPLSSVINVTLADMLFESGQQDLGIRILQEQIALDPGFAAAHETLGKCFLVRGQLPEAISTLESAHRLYGSATGRGYCGLAYLRAGRTNEAQKVLGELLDLERQGRKVGTEIALVQHGMGNDAQALDWLERAAAERAVRLSELYHSPLWADLRPQPRAQAILRKMNLVK